MEKSEYNYYWRRLINAQYFKDLKALIDRIRPSEGEEIHQTKPQKWYLADESSSDEKERKERKISIESFIADCKREAGFVITPKR